MKKSTTELYFALAYDLRRNNSEQSRMALEKLYNHTSGNNKLQQAIAETLAGEYKNTRASG